MGDPGLGSENRLMYIKKYERDKLLAKANILSREIRALEIEQEKQKVQANIEKQSEKLAEISPKDDTPLEIKKCERDKLQVSANIQSLEIRLLELDEEIDRCLNDIELQKEVIKEKDFNIKQQKDLISEGS